MDDTLLKSRSSQSPANIDKIRQQDQQPGHDRPHLPQNIGQLEQTISSIAGSAMLASGLIRGRWSGLLMCGLGSALLYRGLTGHCHAYDALGIDTSDHNDATGVSAGQGVKIEQTITINRKPEDVFARWSDLEGLPKFMRHLESVKKLEGNHSHWIAKGPLGGRVEWDAETINQRKNEMIAWRSLPGSEVDTAGSVHFKPIGNRGTTLKVSLKYNPPGGKAAAAAAWLFGAGLEQELAEDLRRFKSTMEAGEVPTNG